MKFTIVIPTRRRPRQLTACLDSLAAVEYPRTDFEVVVVDDGGGMPAEIIERARRVINIRLVTQAHRGPATARNNGIHAATGTYVAFTDDDCVVDRGWLRALEAALEAHPDAIVGGSTTSSGPAGSPYDVASQNIVDFLYEYYRQAPTSLRFFATNNVACRRELLLSLGGFDESFPRAAAEDRDLCERWGEAGRPFHYEDAARVTHHLDSSLGRFVRQHLRYGQGASYLRNARERRGHPAPRREPLSFYVRLVTFPFRKDTSPRALWLAILAAVSQVAYVMGYITERSLAPTRARGADEAAAAAPDPAALPDAGRSAGS